MGGGNGKLGDADFIGLNKREAHSNWVWETTSQILYERNSMVLTVKVRAFRWIARG
jgi:hypothetical protein